MTGTRCRIWKAPGQPRNAEAAGTAEGDAERVRRDREELRVTATAENFPIKKESLVQAILAVKDLFYRPVVKSLFLEDAVAWLDVGDVRYTPKVKFTGTSGYDHLFDFVDSEVAAGAGADLAGDQPTEPGDGGDVHSCVERYSGGAFAGVGGVRDPE